MKRLRGLLLTSLLLVSASAARALDPKNFETDWTWDQIFASTTGVTSFVVNVGSLAANGRAVWTSTGGPHVVAFSYAVVAAGADATYRISHTTKTYSASARTTAGFNSPAPTNLYSATLAPAISTSAAVTVPANSSVGGPFQAVTVDPVFTLSSLSVAGSYYIYVDIGRAKFQ